MVQLSHAYMTNGKTIALTRWTFVGKALSVLFNMLSRAIVHGGRRELDTSEQEHCHNPSSLPDAGCVLKP